MALRRAAGPVLFAAARQLLGRWLTAVWLCAVVAAAAAPAVAEDAAAQAGAPLVVDARHQQSWHQRSGEDFAAGGGDRGLQEPHGGDDHDHTDVAEGDGWSVSVQGMGDRVRSAGAEAVDRPERTPRGRPGAAGSAERRHRGGPGEEQGVADRALGKPDEEQLAPMRLEESSTRAGDGDRAHRREHDTSRGGHSGDSEASSASRGTSSHTSAAPAREAPAARDAPDARDGARGPSEPAVLALPCRELAHFNPTSSGRSFISAYRKSFSSWLYGNSYQAAIAALAVVIGAFCAWDGPGLWHALFTAAVATAAAGVARFESEGQEFAASNQASQAVLMVQVAAAVALATHSGFEGSQVLVGAALGFGGASACGAWARAADHTVPGVALVWYSVGVVCGILVYTVWRKPVLAAVAPLVGGFLLATGAGTLASQGCGAAFGAKAGERCPALLLPPGTPWSATAMALLGTAEPGVFAGHGACALLALAFHTCDGKRPVAVICLVGGIVVTAASAYTKKGLWQWPVCGCALWAPLTAAAAWRQLGMLVIWEDRSFWRGYFKHGSAPGRAQGYSELQSNVNGYFSPASARQPHRSVDDVRGAPPEGLPVYRSGLYAGTPPGTGSSRYAALEGADADSNRPASHPSLSEWLSTRRTRDSNGLRSTERLGDAELAVH